MSRHRLVVTIASLTSLLALFPGCGGSERVGAESEPGTTSGGGETLSDEVTPVESLDTGGAPSCIAVSAYQVRSATGMRHVVRLRNDCDHETDCTVTTDVAPDPVGAHLGVGEQADLTTYRGWDQPSFTPSVACDE